jgi:recombination protein RecA
MARAAKKKKVEDRLTQLTRAASAFKGFRPASEVLTVVKAVPTCFIQVDHATRVDGWPIERFTMGHGPSNHGKTLFAAGLLKSFLASDNYALHLDAERTSPITWFEKLLGHDLAHHPGFFAQRPDTYEGVIADVRNFLNTLIAQKEKGNLAPDTTAIIVVDSLRKLVPKDVLKEILAAEKDGTFAAKGGDITSGRDRKAQIQAKMNAGWMDEIVPMLEKAGAGMFAIGREMQDPDANQWAKKFGNDYKVGGGGAIFYDSSLVVRIERAGWVQYQKGKDDEKKVVYGERHRVTIKKTKVAGKDDKVAVGYFHSSNGVLTPEGFDHARDVLELGVRLEVIDKSGAWYAFEGERIAAGEHNAVVALTDNPELQARIALETRRAFKTQAPMEHDEVTGGVE